MVGGHQRLKILQELGKTEIYVSVVDLPEDKEKALNIALNKTGGDWDMPKLKDLLEELDTGDFDIEITGFGEDELEELMTQFYVEPEIEEDDFDAASEAKAITEPVTKPGNIWQLGRHRLLCGDSTKIEDVEKLMNGEKADMVFTDPPYNVDYTGKTSDALKIVNDKMSDNQFYQFLLDSFAAMYIATKPGGAIYVCHADSEGLSFRTALKECGWSLKQCLVWVKNVFVLGRQDYQWKHEPILYGWKPGGSHYWQGGRKQSTVIDDFAGVTVQKVGNEHIISFSNGIESLSLKCPSYEVLNQCRDDSTTVWRFEKPLRNGEHPTMKPIRLCARAIQNSSKPKEIVLDLFGGSGSTLMASEQAERTCYTMELDPVYCDVIIKRWEDYTGQKAVLL